MSEAAAQPYEDDFTAVYLTAMTGQIVIPVGQVDLHDSSESSDE
jgi:hypothetical protein